MNTVTGRPIVIIQICFKDLNLYICKQCWVSGYFVHYVWLFCLAIQAVSQRTRVDKGCFWPHVQN